MFHTPFPTQADGPDRAEDVSRLTGGLLPPWLHFALAWQPRQDAALLLQDDLEVAHLCRLILDADGPLMAEAMPLYERHRHRIPETCCGFRKSELLRLCHYRELVSLNRHDTLLRILDRELTRSDHGRLFHCEVLNLFWLSRQGRGTLALKAAEREFALRSDGPPDWRLQRARWRSMGQPQRLLATVLRGSHLHGIHFHPAQLQRQFDCGLAEIDGLVRGLPAGSLERILALLLGGRQLEMHLDRQAWLALRPLLTSLLAGEGQPFSEVPLSCLPCPLPEHPAAMPPATLVIHCPGGRRPADRLLPSGNWRVLLLHEQPPAAENHRTVLSLPWQPALGLDKCLPGTPSPTVLPLRQFVSELEQRYIREVLSHHRGIKTRACESLGITRQTLYSKLGRRNPGGECPD